MWTYNYSRKELFSLVCHIPDQQGAMIPEQLTVKTPAPLLSLTWLRVMSLDPLLSIHFLNSVSSLLFKEHI